MFGIDDALIWGPAIGGLLGAGMSKKPLQGALIGAGLGAGAASIPGLMGGTGVGAQQAAAPVLDAATKTVTPGVMSVESFLSPSQINLANSSIPGTVQSAAPVTDAVTKAVSPIDSFAGMAKKYSPLATTGAQLAGMFGNDSSAPPPAPVQQAVGGNQTLSEIANAGAQQIANQLAVSDQARQQRRMARRGLI